MIGVLNVIVALMKLLVWRELRSIKIRNTYLNVKGLDILSEAFAGLLQSSRYTNMRALRLFQYDTFITSLHSSW